MTIPLLCFCDFYRCIFFAFTPSSSSTTTAVIITMVDPRLKPGCEVEALVTRLMHIGECARQYGSLHKTTTIKGVVVERIIKKNPKTQRNVNTVVVDFDFGNGDIRRKVLSLRSLQKYVPPPSIQSPSRIIWVEPVSRQQQQIQLVTDSQNDNINTYLAELNVNDDIDNNNNNITNLNPTELPINDNTLVSDLIALENEFDADFPMTENEEITTTTTTAPIASVLVPTPTTPDRRTTRHMASPLRLNVVATCLGEDWFEEPDSLQTELNGKLRYRGWQLITSIGDVIRGGDNNNDDRFSRLDIFLMMFPPNELEVIINTTNHKLEEKQIIKTTRGEIIRFFGTLILITKYEFGSRSSLWSSHPPTKYENAPMFGAKTGFTRKRFNEIFTNIRFADQPDQKPDNMTSEQFRWLLVDGFVKEFNSHRVKSFKPSELICVDESISRWYGQGGDWINHGLPMYVAIDRKPENGCEIQDACCGRTGVMLQLLIVKTKKEQSNTLDFVENETHGTTIIKKLVQPWAYSDRIVCADSFFASYNCAKVLKNIGFKFVGVVKTATKRFPMKVLTTKRLHERGDRYGLVHKDRETGRPDMIAFVWMDRERRYFISTGPCLTDGEPYRRWRWRQIEDVATDTPPERVELVVEQPKAAEVYYSVCGKVDQHNRDRQSTLCIEKKLRTNDWSMRVNLTILSMIIVDTWKIWNALTNESIDNDNNEKQKTFYGHLASELIDNNLDKVGGRKRNVYNNDDEDFGGKNLHVKPRSGIGAHITPTKLRLNDKSTHSKQGRCRVCKQKTTYCCSVCNDDINTNDEGWICHTKLGKSCFPEHLRQCHELD